MSETKKQAGPNVFWPWDTTDEGERLMLITIVDRLITPGIPQKVDRATVESLQRLEKKPKKDIISVDD